MSFKPEVQVAGESAWAGNALRFATEAEAQRYVLDLAMRWTAVADTRVIPSEDDMTARIVNNTLQHWPWEITP